MPAVGKDSFARGDTAACIRRIALPGAELVPFQTQPTVAMLAVSRPSVQAYYARPHTPPALPPPLPAGRRGRWLVKTCAAVQVRASATAAEAERATAVRVETTRRITQARRLGTMLRSRSPQVEDAMLQQATNSAAQTRFHGSLQSWIGDLAAVSRSSLQRLLEHRTANY